MAHDGWSASETGQSNVRHCRSSPSLIPHLLVFSVWRFQIVLLPFGHPSYMASVIIERWTDHCTEGCSIRYIWLRRAYLGLGIGHLGRCDCWERRTSF